MYVKIFILPRSFCAPRQSGAHGMYHACHTLDMPLRSTLWSAGDGKSSSYP